MKVFIAALIASGFTEAQQLDAMINGAEPAAEARLENFADEQIRPTRPSFPWALVTRPHRAMEPPIDPDFSVKPVRPPVGHLDLPVDPLLPIVRPPVGHLDLPVDPLLPIVRPPVGHLDLPVDPLLPIAPGEPVDPSFPARPMEPKPVPTMPVVGPIPPELFDPLFPVLPVKPQPIPQPIPTMPVVEPGPIPGPADPTMVVILPAPLPPVGPIPPVLPIPDLPEDDRIHIGNNYININVNGKQNVGSGKVTDNEGYRPPAFPIMPLPPFFPGSPEYDSHSDEHSHGHGHGQGHRPGHGHMPFNEHQSNSIGHTTNTHYPIIGWGAPTDAPVQVLPASIKALEVRRP